jgi:23S rRNA (cytidine1920-2'-O)/16S rRNA (cytidine1409-2'-O)-methyltransferase
MRIDVYLTQYGHTPSRARAQQLISSGQIQLDGTPVTKAGMAVDENISHTVEIAEDIPFVGRGGCKLEAALDAFGLSANDAVAVDIGASTGGFTDCLLRRGAKKVYAVDSGSGQLAPALLADERVVNMEKCNARYLTPDALGEGFLSHGGADVVVMDVSFISQTYIHPVIHSLLKQDGFAVTLIKPQFEVGREHLGKSGIVKQPKWRRAAVEKILDSAAAVGLTATKLIRSPIEGGDGNVEYLVLLRHAEAAEQTPLDAEHLPATLFEA